MERSDLGPLNLPLNGDAAGIDDIAELEQAAHFLVDPMLEDTRWEHSYANPDGGIISFRTDEHEWEVGALDVEVPVTHPGVTIFLHNTDNKIFSLRFGPTNLIEALHTTNHDDLLTMTRILRQSRQVRVHTDAELGVFDYLEQLALDIITRRDRFTVTNPDIEVPEGYTIHVAHLIREVVRDTALYPVTTKKYTSNAPDTGRIEIVSNKLGGLHKLDSDTDVLPTLTVTIDDDYQTDQLRYKYERLHNRFFDLQCQILTTSEEKITFSPTGNVALTQRGAELFREQIGMNIPGKPDVKRLSQILFETCMQTAGI